MRDDVKDRVKEVLKRVTEHTTPEEMAVLKETFKDVIKDADPLVIAAAEGELVKEGATLNDLMKACDIHLEMFKDAIKNPNLKLAEDHPITSFQRDHINILNLMEQFIETLRELKGKGSFEKGEKEMRRLALIAEKLMEAENHNVRQENTLFPILERHGIEQPPAIMWHDHTEMKEQKKRIIKAIKEAGVGGFNLFISRIEPLAVSLLERFAGHTQKEENILYVTAVNVITEEEWKDIKEECDNLGYFIPDIR